MKISVNETTLTTFVLFTLAVWCWNHEQHSVSWYFCCSCVLQGFEVVLLCRSEKCLTIHNFFFFHFICTPDKLQHYKLKDLPYNERLKIFQSYSPYYKILKNSLFKKIIYFKLVIRLSYLQIKPIFAYFFFHYRGDCDNLCAVGSWNRWLPSDIQGKLHPSILRSLLDPVSFWKRGRVIYS